MDEKEVKDTTVTDSGGANPTPPKKEEDKNKINLYISKDYAGGISVNMI